MIELEMTDHADADYFQDYDDDYEDEKGEHNDQDAQLVVSTSISRRPFRQFVKRFHSEETGSVFEENCNGIVVFSQTQQLSIRIVEAEEDEEAHDDDDDDDDDDNQHYEKPRKSIMEKLRQLQVKNELYKEEFRRVQKDRL